MNRSLSMLTSIASNSMPIDGILHMMPDVSTAGCRHNAAAEANWRESARKQIASGDENCGSLLEARNGIYAAALATLKLNVFGQFNEFGDEIGLSLAPLIAMVNHSCCKQTFWRNISFVFFYWPQQWYVNYI